MRTRTLCTVILLMVALLVWPAAAQEQKQKPRVPNFTLMSNQGRAVSLADYAGKVVIIEFWASWCHECRAEMPELQRLHNELMETGDAVLLLLNQIDGELETQAKGNQYLVENGFDFINLYDFGSVGAGIFGVPGYPTTVVIDGEGYLRSFVLGQVTYGQVKQLIEEAK